MSEAYDALSHKEAADVYLTNMPEYVEYSDNELVNNFNEFMKYRDADFIARARLMGISNSRILFVHILPNMFSHKWNNWRHNLCNSL